MQTETKVLNAYYEKKTQSWFEWQKTKGVFSKICIKMFKCKIELRDLAFKIICTGEM